MADSSPGPFRQKSLERLSSPERLDQLLRVVDRRSWLPLVTLGLLIAVMLLWSVFGEIPVYIEGRGILVRPRSIVELSAPGSGYLEELAVAVGDEIERGDLLARIARPDLEKRFELQTEKRRELTALRQTVEILRMESGGLDGGEVDGHVDAVRALAQSIKNKEIQALEEERTQVGEELKESRQLRDARARRHATHTRLKADGMISEQQLLEDEELWLDSIARVSRLEAQSRGLRTRELEIEERFLDRLRRIADFKLEMQDYEQQIAEVDREIARIRVSLEEESEILAEHSGRILELSAFPGLFVGPGARLGAMELRRATDPLEGLVYFTVRQGKRLRIDAHPRALITPDTVERQRFGGLVGTVRRVSRFPVSLNEVESQIGNRELAELLIQDGYRVQVLVDLEPGEQPGEYLWSSAKDPDVELTVGTTTTARIAVERRQPITFVLPFLKKMMGVD
jgi:HlyD family secretion protein